MVSATRKAPAADEPVFNGADKVAIEELYDLCLQAFVTQDDECIQAPSSFSREEK